ncbi:S8 family peptidase [Allokutzneria oryzae]|uniref:S8 family serine peptidase n=1 Tax=Allokutzneria oryzae TaxID=1378989 RepID=A0ABV5ZSE7_9PSEU
MRIAVRAFAVTALVALAAPATAHAADGWELPAMSVPAAHAVSKGDGVTVAVIDTGVRTGHPALAGRASEGPDFMQENDKDQPWYGRHGTSMASSVLDVAPGAKVLGLRAIRDREDPKYVRWQDQIGKSDPSSKGVDSVAKAIRYATDNGARVISMSLGTDTPFAAYQSSEADAVTYALSKGVVVIASLGNEGDEDNPVAYPAAYPGVLTVAASTPDGSRAPFSSVHSYADVAAPGVAIYGADISGGRKRVNGTSSAGALTAGVAALIVAKYPGLAPRQVEQLLQRTASTASAGHNPLTGYGVVNAAGALKAAAALTPESAVLPVRKDKPAEHFGQGDDGTPRMTNVPIEMEYIAMGAVFGVPGLLAIVIGWLLRRSGKKMLAAAPR